MTAILRTGRAALTIALTCVTLLFGMAQPANARATRTCSSYSLPVRIADPGPADQTLWGQLCYPGTVRPRIVQLLVHGATYNHLYWDFPAGNGYYSYVNAATAAGYATFNVDRIGAGNSSHPSSDRLTMQAYAVAMHDAVTALRSGSLDGHAFSGVVWVGHSMGAALAWYEIPRYHDVDAAILTSALHGTPNPEGIAIFYPATSDPKFAGSGLDAGYITTQPGQRGYFYDPATTAPAVLTVDEANKDVVAVAPSAAPATPYDITVPVLLVDGATDRAQCPAATEYDCTDQASVLAYESQFYLPQAHLEVHMIPHTGHNVALSTTASVADAVMLAWIRSHVS
ncbi:alpha/beta hydrolase [Dactylosporangium roseum]|uniref:Alpha/beta hydrolase n=1 Tax=Dactylosporangium roseum TaxID=47989 RepID=A0ABY5ZB16_9ACTN|nr:alpha/beta hydrolase [Dactylosporangium roseum]UWZ39293.1 alpha/beta hydrolase [Dactylosporangium roseum]